MRPLLASAAFLLLSAALTTTPAAAQTMPARDTAAQRSTAEKPPVLKTQGEYAAPGMTGAPKQQVLTDYDNQPIRPAVKEKAQTSLSTQPVDPKDAKPLKMKRPPKRD